MTDLHSHILYGVDDGARSLDESREMLAQAKDMGYTKIVSTRHWVDNQLKVKSEKLKVSENLKILKQEAVEAGIEILRGTEVMISPETLEEIVDGRVDTLGGSQTVLMEFQIGSIDRSGIESVKRVVDAGYTPLVAHVERYRWKRETLVELKKLGAVLQMNIRAAAMGRDEWREWLTAGLIDILATDAHRAEGRSYELAEEMKILRELLGEERFEILTEINPGRLLADERLPQWKGEEPEQRESDLLGKFLRFIGRSEFIPFNRDSFCFKVINKDFPEIILISKGFYDFIPLCQLNYTVFLHIVV